MLIIEFYTNLDDYKREDWPINFPVIPNIGDYVRSLSGKELKIIRKTWVPTKTQSTCTLLIELHK
jgi:hypothetical protein